MNKTPLFQIKRQLEIVLESFQGIETLASDSTEAYTAQDVSKAMVPSNLMLEDIINQLDRDYLPQRDKHSSDPILTSAPGEHENTH